MGLRTRTCLGFALGLTHGSPTHGLKFVGWRPLNEPPIAHKTRRTAQGAAPRRGPWHGGIRYLRRDGAAHSARWDARAGRSGPSLARRKIEHHYGHHRI